MNINILITYKVLKNNKSLWKGGGMTSQSVEPSQNQVREDMDKCDITFIHHDVINKVNKDLPDDEILYDLAEFYKVFADSTRIKILYVLLKSVMCVCDISELLNVSQSAVSHQLRMLKQMKLVKYRREGKAVFYSLSDHHIELILSQGLEHISE